MGYSGLTDNYDDKAFNETLESLNQRVKTICKREGITLRGLAKRMEVQPDSLSRSMKSNPTFKTLASIAQGLRVDIVDLLPPSQFSNEIRGIVTYRDKHFVINSVFDLIELANKFAEKEAIKK